MVPRGLEADQPGRAGHRKADQGLCAVTRSMPVVNQQKRVPGVAQHHVERVHASAAHMGEQLALIVLVDMGLRAGTTSEPAVQHLLRDAVTAAGPPSKVWRPWLSLIWCES